MAEPNVLQIAEVILRLEDLAVKSNYGMPRSVIMAPEKRKLMRSGFYVTTDTLFAIVRNNDVEVSKCTEYVDNGGYYQYRKDATATFNFNVKIAAIKVVGDNPRGYVRANLRENLRIHIRRPQMAAYWWYSLSDEENNVSQPSLVVRTGGEISSTPADVIRAEAVDAWETDCNMRYPKKISANFDEIVISDPERDVGANRDFKLGHEFVIGRRTIEHLRTGQRHTYNKSATKCGHCAIGSNWLRNEEKVGVYELWWHVGEHRYRIGEYHRPYKHGSEAYEFYVQMLSWRVFVVRPTNELCYIA